MLVNMEVVGVRIEMPSNQPIVLLKEIEGTRFLPIWVGAVEATAIAFAQQGMAAQRPLIQIRDSQSALLKVSARPSDAIAIALRTKSNILADSDLLDLVGIDIPERLLEVEGVEDITGAKEGAATDLDLERFREFLDQINPEDFAG